MNTYSSPERVEDMTEKTQIMFRVSESFHALLKSHAKEHKWTMTGLFSRACEYYLEWIKGDPHRIKKLVAAPIKGQDMRMYIKNDVKAQLEASRNNYPMVDVYFTVVWRYAKDHGLFDQDFATPGNCIVTLDPTEKKLIGWLILDKQYKSFIDFYEQAATWWLDHHANPPAGIEFNDYYARRILSEDQDPEEAGLENVTMVTPAHIHRRLVTVSERDKQALRTVYYNFVVCYLDHLLDVAEEGALEKQIASDTSWRDDIFDKPDDPEKEP